MTGRVIERFGTTVVDGLIYHDDRPVTWEDADMRAGRRLDRRKVWAFVEGKLSECVSWTSACSGCAYGFDPRGPGCSECGYHGVVRSAMWVPATAHLASYTGHHSSDNLCPAERKKAPAL